MDLSALSLCARLLDLDRPLAVFDLETTGTDVENDAIIQVGIARLESGGTVSTFSTLVDPNRAVPDTVQKITGITTSMVQGSPTLRDVAPDINRMLGDADLCGYNVLNFDLPFLEHALQRVGACLVKPDHQQVLDVYQVYRKLEPHTLERAVAEYTGQPFQQSHQALDDVQATADVLAAQLARYGLTGSLRDVISTVRHPYLDGERMLKADGDCVVICFGKHEGATIEEVAQTDPSYLNWVVAEIGGEVGAVIAEQCPGITQ